MIQLLAVTVTFADNAPVWGINAITLQPTISSSLSAVDLLTNNCVVSLNRFYRAGGINLPATPTECRITYDQKNLFVIFRCTENDMTFPAIRHGTNWFSLLHSPAEQDAVFPDKVDLFIQPDMANRSYYQFAATLDGLKFGCQRNDETSQTEEAGDNTPVRVEAVEDFDAAVIRGTNEWVAFFRIPWEALGGKPNSDFGLLPIRTHWRDGEVSSPVAFDFAERPPTDIFIETHLGNKASVDASQTNLCQLPSGTLRWQRPALLSYPDAETIQQIWRMEQSLSQPTDKTNFAERLYLTQRWIDLLTLEGFNFRAGNGSIAKKGMEPSAVRNEINAALRNKNMQHACKLLDIFLRKLDESSQDWFADGSPADILKDEWIPISKLDDVELQTNVLLMHGRTGDQKMDLHLSLPTTGGVRIYADHQGYFKPANLLPLHVVQSSNSCSVKMTNGRIVINKSPMAISFYDTAGNLITQIGTNDIAFRFNHDGKVSAVDFKNHLDANEIIYGFGEKYDHFNEDGNVLTLWGIDDWQGNIVGLMNQSYKPVPILQSSKGYMIFDNSTYRLRADIGKAKPTQYRLTQQGSIFDYYFWITPPKIALESYTALTGKPILPPKWAFEPWMGRTGRGWNSGPLHDAVAEEENVVERFEKLDIPHSAIYSEGPGADSPVMIQFMAAHNLKVLSWFYPSIGERTQQKLMPELNTNELPLLRAETDDIPWPLVDFTNPNALELARRWWKHRLEIGVAGSMVDFGDRVPEDAIFFNGWRGDEMHNFYSYDYHKTYSEVFREARGSNFILFARAAAPGTQKWIAQFAGDHPANFRGLQGVLTGALSLCACGFSTWGSDVGGFLGWPEPAVYMRWVQFGCFSPLMRCHGRTPREPWNYGDAAVANYKCYAWVRENLLDYIYNAAVEAHETGVPMMRSMPVAFPDEPALAGVGDEYMFGDDLLVAPVISENNFRIIHFPRGRWTSLWNGKTIFGPTNIQVSVPLDEIPVYLKQGAAMSVQLNPSLEFGESITRGRVNAVIVTPTGKEENISLLNNRGQDGSVTLQPTNGGFFVMLKNFPETDYLLIYDAAVAAVKVDGKILPKLAVEKLGSMPAGWQMDSSVNRLVIHLPASQAHQRKIEVEFQREN